MSDKSQENNRKEEDAPPTSPQSSATKEVGLTTLEDEASQQEEIDDGDRKPPALEIHFEEHSILSNHPPMAGSHEVSHEYPCLISSMNDNGGDESPYTNRMFVNPFLPRLSGHNSFAEGTTEGIPEGMTGGFDSSTQAEGTTSPPNEGAVGLERGIVSLRSYDLAPEGDAYHSTTLANGFDDVARMPPNDHQEVSLFQRTYYPPSFDFPYPQAFYPPEPHPGAPHHTPIQPVRYQYSCPPAVAFAEGGEDEHYSSDNNPPGSPTKAKSNGKAKAKATKAQPKKKSKPKKRRARGSRNSNGSSSSSSPGGDANTQAYSHIRPGREELAAAQTERARGALHSWYNRLRDMYKFREQHGHTRVPQKYPKNRELGVWVNKQRMEKKTYDDGNAKSSMTTNKISKLEEAGFVWAKPKGVDAWEQRFEELQKYVKEFGDPHVPTKYPDNRALGRWVSTQRNMYKKFHTGEKCNSLSRDEMQRRLTLLNSVEFSWRMDRPPSSESEHKNASQEDDTD